MDTPGRQREQRQTGLNATIKPISPHVTGIEMRGVIISLAVSSSDKILQAQLLLQNCIREQMYISVCTEAVCQMMPHIK